MNLPHQISVESVQIIEPNPNAVYTIEAAEHIARVPRFIRGQDHSLLIEVEGDGRSVKSSTSHDVRSCVRSPTVREGQVPQ